MMSATSALPAVLVALLSIVTRCERFQISTSHMQARYIILNGGNFNIGTKAMPYPGKATITLRGRPDDRELPGYGSKVLAIRQGNLTLHGRHREPTWTQLRAGAPLAVGDNALTVEGTVNWRAGDVIVVTSSSFYADEVDELTIASVQVTNSGAATTITTVERAQFHHLAAVLDEHAAATGGLTVDMRAEVAVLSRDIVIEGDEESAQYMFGATVMLSSPRLPQFGQSNMWLEQIEARLPASVCPLYHAACACMTVIVTRIVAERADIAARCMNKHGSCTCASTPCRLGLPLLAMFATPAAACSVCIELDVRAACRCATRARRSGSAATRCTST
jgi:G8 domain